MSGTTYTYSVFTDPCSVEMVQRSDGLTFPLDPGNPNFAAYQSWLTAGNKATAFLPPLSLKNALAIQAAGLAIASTSTPTLNGTYRCDGLALQGIQAEANALILGGSTPVFADGSASLNWADKSGAVHTFTPAQFLELVHAVNYFVSQCAQYASGASATVPTGTATIA